MNKGLRLLKTWPEVKEMIKEINVEITDEDLEYTPGNEDELFKKLSDKTGMTQENVKVWIESVSGNEGIAS